MNPADELLSIFKQWESSDASTLFLARGDYNQATIKTAQEVTYASMLFQQIIDFLGDDEDLGPFVEDTWNYLFAPESFWSTGDSQRLNIIPSTVKIGLRGASSMISQSTAQELPVVEFSDNEITTLVVTLEQMKEQLRSLPKMHRKLANDITIKIDACISLLTGDSVDSWRLRQARQKSFEIVGESIHAVILLPEEKRQSFFDNLCSISGAWVGNTTAGGVGGVLATAASQYLQLGP